VDPLCPDGRTARQGARAGRRTDPGKPSPFDHPDAAGELYWGGVAGTQWWISPKKNMAGVMMAQRQMSFVHPFSFEFKRLAYEAARHGGKEAAKVPLRKAGG
jgi:CubicO group peptidase (beta-lactamase class C family)